MTTQHTQGRLTVTSKYTLCTDDGKTPVASTYLIDSVSQNDGENARRLVACWNACEAIPTTYLESWALYEIVQDLLISQAQRDELLGALKDLTHALNEDDLLHDDRRSAFSQALAAIAKVEGKS